MARYGIVAGVAVLVVGGGVVGPATAGQRPTTQVSASAVTANLAAASAVLRQGARLTAGQSIAAGQYTLTMQSDGNLVMRGNGRVLWTTGTAKRAPGGYATVRNDGAFAVRTKAGKSVWNAKPAGSGASLYIQTNGDLVLYNRAKKAIWRANRPGANVMTAGATLRGGQFVQARRNGAKLTMQADGRLVQSGSYGGVVWSKTCVAGSVLSAQADGRLTVTTPTGGICWSLPRLEGSKSTVTVLETNVVEQTSTSARRVVTPSAALDAYKTSHADRLVFEQINAQRTTAGRKALRWNDRLAASARAHNLAMAKADRLSHQLSGQPALGTRVSNAGYAWLHAAENIGSHTNTSFGGALALQNVMLSPGGSTDTGRTNLLDPRLVDVGVDVRIVDGTLWLTEDFGQPR